jgi:hypothetical protein
MSIRLISRGIRPAFTSGAHQASSCKSTFTGKYSVCRACAKSGCVSKDVVKYQIDGFKVELAHFRIFLFASLIITRLYMTVNFSEKFQLSAELSWNFSEKFTVMLCFLYCLLFFASHHLLYFIYDLSL